MKGWNAAGVYALGFLSGYLAFGLGLGIAMREIEQGKSLDRMLEHLATRGWRERAKKEPTA